ncbi:MAG: hypothetical protein WC791_01150 [Candidatus Paceibacterota bacterium]
MQKVQKERDDGFRRDGGRGKRGWGGKLNNHEILTEISPDDMLDEYELHKRLSALHQSYFNSETQSTVTFESIWMASLKSLHDKFAEYDTVRAGKRDPKRLASIMATLLGLNNAKKVSA